MKLTIRHKLIAGFTGVLLLMAVVAVNGCFAFLQMRRSAHDATTIGGRLNSIGLEVQVHNLEAQRRIRNYLLEVKAIGPVKAREMYLDEAEFEMHEIETLAHKAVLIAPDSQKRAKFEKVVQAEEAYEVAVRKMVGAATAGGDDKAAIATYEDAALRLHEGAEDGEVAGREASQASEEEVKRVSDRSMVLATVISLCGLLLGCSASYLLSRAILAPVEHLREVAENVSMGNLNCEVRRFSNDEIGDLADSFSRMLTAVKYFRMEAEILQQEALAGEAGK